MLFDKFIKQYIEDLIECSDKEYDLTEEDKKDIMERVCDNDRFWETLDDIVFNYLEDYEKESE